MSIKQSHELKQLTVRAQKLEAELVSIDKELMTIRQNRSKLDSTLQSIHQRISELTDKQPTVSEHALLRYMERVKAFDLSLIENEILSPQNRAIINASPNKSCKIKKSGYELVVKNGVVISVIK